LCQMRLSAFLALLFLMGSWTDGLSKEKYNAIVLSDAWRVRIVNIKEVHRSRIKKVLILNEMGARQHAPMISYDKSTKISALELEISSAQGEKKFGKKDFQDIGATSEMALIDDNRKKLFELPTVSFPYTVELAYETISKNSIFIPPWLPISSMYTKVQSASYTINAPANFEIFTNEKLPNSVVSQRAKNRLSYELKDLKSIEREFLAPKFWDIAPHVQFGLNQFHYEGYEGKAESWNDFGKWFINSLYRQRQNLTADQKEEVRKLTSELKSKSEKVKRVYEFLQQKSRYIFIALGAGGFQPLEAKESYSKGYGDCKALSNLMVCMLDAIDIPAYCVIVDAGSEKQNLIGKKPIIQGNHMISCVPIDQDTIWLECTSQSSPFNYLGDFTDDRNVLLLSENGSKIIRTPNYLDKHNESHVYNISIDKTFKASYKRKTMHHGYFYEFAENLKKEKEDERREYYKKAFPNLNIGQTDIVLDKEKIEALHEIEGTFKVKHFKIEDGILAQLIPHENLLIELNQKENRQYPIQINRKLNQKWLYKILLPNGISIKELPKNLNITNDMFSYQMESSKIENGCQVNCTFQLNEGRYNADRYLEFQKDIQKILKAQKSKFYLNNNK